MGFKKPKKTKATQPETRTVPPQDKTTDYSTREGRFPASEASIAEVTERPVAPVSEPVLQSSASGGSSEATASLDKKVSDENVPEEILELLTFRLANEEYAVDILKVKEIIRLVEITRVPRTSPAIKGIISLRGTIVPVFDLRTRLGLSESPPDRKTRIVVVVISKGLMGLIVDEVTEVVKIKANEIEPPPSTVGGSEAEHLIGVARSSGRLLILLNLEKALSLGP